MKKKKLFYIVAPLVLISLFTACIVSGFLTAYATTSDTRTDATTDTSIGFTPGTVQFTGTAPDLPFGVHTIPTVATNYKVVGSPSMTISDARGSNAGWGVNVGVSFFTEATTGTSIPATVLGFTEVPLEPGAGTSGNAPNAHSVDVASSAALTKARIITAAVGTGAGQWTATWTDSQLQLKILSVANILNENYTATVEWELVNAP